jgi:hypothetical protein
MGRAGSRNSAWAGLAAGFGGLACACYTVFRTFSIARDGFRGADFPPGCGLYPLLLRQVKIETKALPASWQP